MLSLPAKDCKRILVSSIEKWVYLSRQEKVEPGKGFEPSNLLITNQLLYQLSYPGKMNILSEIRKIFLSLKEFFAKDRRYSFPAGQFICEQVISHS